MLLQSHDDAIHLLPALPDAWPNGTVKGLMVRGGFKIDMSWADHKITSLTIHASKDGVCRLRLPQPASNKLLKKSAGAPREIFNIATDIREPLIKNNEKDLSVALPPTWLYDFTAVAGKTYVLISK